MGSTLDPCHKNVSQAKSHLAMTPLIVIKRQNENILMKMKNIKKLKYSLLTISLVFSGMLSATTSLNGKPFPQLFGMNIGAKNYDNTSYQNDLAKLDAVVLGFYKGWKGDINGEKIGSVLRNIKAINPNILLGQYTILNETYNLPNDTSTVDKLNKVNNEKWWLLDKDGRMLQWTSSYYAWDINITSWTKADSAGQRYPEWLANRDYQVYFKNIPEFDIWYFDNVFWRPRLSQADWKQNGTNISNQDNTVQSAYRQAQVLEWQTAANLAPALMQMGNVDSDMSDVEFKGKLPGAFIEAIMGKSWSLFTWSGWSNMMSYYDRVIKNSQEPSMVVFNVWGSPTNYRFFRFAFTSSLLNNGYFSFTDETKGYSSVPWFDEYNVNLGNAIDGPQMTPAINGVYQRQFENGMVLVNPSTLTKSITIPAGYRFIAGTQDTITNSGQPATTVTLPAQDGFVLVKI